MQHKIRLYAGTANLDERTSLAQMQANCPLFFRTKHGKRETYTVYRGCLIVRNTVYFGGRATRATSVYLYLTDYEDGPDLHNVAGCAVNSIERAKRLIDLVIEKGYCTYGMNEQDAFVEQNIEN